MIDQRKLEESSGQYPLNPAVPEDLPHPAYWPVLLAFSILFFFWGFVSSWIISLIGLLSMGISVTGWIWELSDE